jgi:uncharacterized protein YjbI with pentapeptide repeats
MAAVAAGGLPISLRVRDCANRGKVSGHMSEKRIAATSPSNTRRPAVTDTHRSSTATSALEQKQRELLKALNGTSQSARTSWLFFVTFMAYMFVAIASVSHTDLLLNAPIKLPLLQIDIPLTTFFLISPVLFVLVHFGVLLHHAMLSQKAFALNELFRRDEANAPRSHYLRFEVSSYFFAQSAAGPRRNFITRILLGSMTFLTLDLLPLLLLLYFQVAYLPIHDSATTWYHRSYICADLVVLLLVGIGRRAAGEGLIRYFRSGIRISGNTLLNVLAWPTILFGAICVATLPADVPSLERDIGGFMMHLRPAKVPFDAANQDCKQMDGNRCAFWLTAFIFEQPIDYVSGRRPWFSRNLVVTDKETLLPSHGSNSPEAMISLRGRDLRYATFDRSNLHLVDFTASNLSGASLKGADLSEALLGCAIRGRRYVIRTDATGAKKVSSEDDDDCTVLSDADLSEAKLTNGTINRAVLGSVNLSRTDLHGFDLKNLNLSGSNLSETDLRGADLSSSLLDGVLLFNASAEGASFAGSFLRGADLAAAHLDGADLTNAVLSGALLSDASLLGVEMTGALFFGANLSGARLWQTKASPEKAYSLAVLSDLTVIDPTESDLPRFEQSLEVLKSLENNVERSAAIRRLSGLLNQSARDAWRDSEDERNWKSLVAKTKASEQSDESRGAFLGDLACDDPPVFRGITRTHFWLYPSYIDYITYTPDMVLPPGVTREEIAQIQGDLGSADLSKKSVRYLDRPDILLGFYNQIKKNNCTKSASDWPATLSEL